MDNLNQLFEQYSDMNTPVAVEPLFRHLDLREKLDLSFINKALQGLTYSRIRRKESKLILYPYDKLLFSGHERNKYRDILTVAEECQRLKGL